MVVGAGSAAPGVAADPALHAVLLGDGRLLTYGTGNPNRNDPTQQTGFFIYDIWGPDLGVGPESHLTLPNQTATDLFCSAQIVLPQSGKVLITGGDNFDPPPTPSTGTRPTQETTTPTSATRATTTA
jgi:hypothetical protein